MSTAIKEILEGLKANEDGLITISKSVFNSLSDEALSSQDILNELREENKRNRKNKAPLQIELDNLKKDSEESVLKIAELTKSNEDYVTKITAFSEVRKTELKNKIVSLKIQENDKLKTKFPSEEDFDKLEAEKVDLYLNRITEYEELGIFSNGKPPIGIPDKTTKEDPFKAFTQ